MHTIENTIDIAAPLAKLHTAITTEAGFRGWWAEDTTYDAATKSYTFRFAKPEHTMAVTFRVERVDANGIVLVCTRDDNNPDWMGTRLAIELAPSGTGTRVHLVHSGYPAKNELYAQCTKGWQFFIESLAKYATTGTGQPFARLAA